jgi:hypothetical protein
MTTLAQTVVECRRIPRSARIRQGFPRLKDFARHVHRLQAERRARPAPNPTPSEIVMKWRERVTILARLTRIIEDDAGLRLAARRAAVDWSNSGYGPLGGGWTPPLKVVWSAPPSAIEQLRKHGLSATTPHVIRYGDGPNGGWKAFQPRAICIAVPAAWLLARLRQQAGAMANLSVVVREINQAILDRAMRTHELREIHKQVALVQHRVTILSRLQRIIEDDDGLQLAACRAAVDWSYPAYRPPVRRWARPIEMVWSAPEPAIEQLRNQGLPLTTPGVVGSSYPWRSRHRIPRHCVAVPAAWLLARLREQAKATTNLSIVVREADRAILAREQQLRKQREMIWHAAAIRRECEAAWEQARRAWRIHSDPAVIATQPDPGAPDTLGWRIWHWDAERQLLRSPDQGTLWHSGELLVERWDVSSVLRGRGGIHARRMPRNWLQAEWGNHDGPVMSTKCLSGVVERFGRYVLGTVGWRAEWVVIRKLRAPTTEIGLALETAYPEVEVIYEDR